MIINDILMSNMLFSFIPKINTGSIILDTLYFILITFIFYYISNSKFKNNIFKNLFDFNKSNKLIYTSSSKNTSKRFRAIMYFISKNNDLSIKKLIEIIDTKYSHITDSYEETKQTGYRVEQTTQFIIDKNINGKVYYKEKEIINDSGKSKYEEIIYLEIFSNNLTLIQLQEWVDSKLKEHDLHIKSKIIDKQLLIEIGWNVENKNIIVNYNQWQSNVSFDNRFFTNKDIILEKINFFIKNQDWYKERGIPWTLGFLLWGKPGCGKTGFIKALMNITKRSAITIKLNNKFDLNKLKRIIYDDEITEEFIIPQQNRILIFEDIDCMSDIVIDRELKNNEKNILEEALMKKLKDPLEKLNLIDTCDDNNLSYFLNILDGLHECPGRIIIMTTNKPEVLDSALVRSGRIDYKIEFTFATLKDIQDILSFYWKDNNIELINSNVNLKYSHADIVNMCRTSNNLEESINKLNLILFII